MKFRILLTLVFIALASLAFATQSAFFPAGWAPVPDSNCPDGQGPARGAETQAQSSAGASDQSRDYRLGPGDAIEVTVIGIQELDKKEFVLDARGLVKA